MEPSEATRTGPRECTVTLPAAPVVRDPLWIAAPSTIATLAASRMEMSPDVVPVGPLKIPLGSFVGSEAFRPESKIEPAVITIRPGARLLELVLEMLAPPVTVSAPTVSVVSPTAPRNDAAAEIVAPSRRVNDAPP